jgi:hypothetical protein
VFELFPYSFNHLRVTVTCIKYRDAAGKVYVLPPLDIPEPCVFGTVNVDRSRGRYAARDAKRASGKKLGIRCHFGSVSLL